MANHPVPAPNQGHRHTLIRTVVLMAAILALSVGVTLCGPQIVDTVKSSSYQPGAQMAAATNRLQLTSRGVQILYATAPTIETREQFNASCQSEERTAAILGCYFKDRTYLFDVQNNELDGALEVTAAHEMLHAAYQRLNIFERPRVDALIEAEYAKIKDQEDIKQAVAYYAKSEPGSEVNELHSIIGTTVGTLTPELERYYAQYFNDRSVIVSLNQQYTTVFASINKQATELQASLKADEQVITADLASYQADQKQIEIDIASFNERAKSGGFSTQQAFQLARSALVSRVDALNVRRDEINQRVSEYNKKIEALNHLSTRAGELNQSINGATATTGLE